MSTLRVTETTLRSLNKKGIFKPDENGYYTMIVGGLNCYNSVGEYYVAKDSVDLFDKSAHLARRIREGQLRGELAHPTRIPGMSDQEWVTRMMTIEPSRVCCHFADIWPDVNFGRNNPQYNNPELVAIMARLKPSGVFGASLQQSLDNPEENVAFSIRSITNAKMVNGRFEKTVTQIMTFDYVVEPGINIATKWASPSIEERVLFNLPNDMLVRVAENEIACTNGTESTKAIFSETLEMLRKQEQKHLLEKQPSRLHSW